jgi:POT family proton-dependent oligopeptide transporter
MVGVDGKIGWYWLAGLYFIHTAAELCLSPIGLSMVTKLAPPRFVGLAMGGWFLSLAAGGDFSGLVARSISGAHGMTVASALSGFSFCFWVLLGSGAVLLAISPLINRLMHGVR